jgi:hypothetical protein
MKMQVLLAGLLVLAANTAVAQERPTAQAGDTAVTLDIVFVVFPDSAAASQALSGMSTEQRGHLHSYRMVSRDKSGKVTARKRHDKEGGSATTQRAGQSIDGVVALLGERPQQDTSGAANPSAQGYAPGQTSAKGTGVSPTDVSRMQDMLAPGNTAVILVVEDPYGQDLGSEMRQTDSASDVIAVPLIPVPDSAQ